jgi:hypothetical protein
MINYLFFMKEKILIFLKTKLTGVAENYLLGVAEHYSKTITDDKQIETTLTDGVIDLLKLNAGLLQQEGDKRATEAQKTALKNFLEKHGLNEDGTQAKKPGRPPKESDPEEPAWFKAYREQSDATVTELKTKLENQEKEKHSAVLIDRVKGHEKLKGVPASFLKGRNLIPESEDKIDQLVAALETDYNSFKQEMAEKGIVISVPPTGGGAAGDKSTIDEYLDDKFPKKESKK